MKKTLILAALIAAATAHFRPRQQTVVIVDEDAVEAKCFVLPLLPDCAAQWNDYWQAKGYHCTTPYAWWTCKPAEAWRRPSARVRHQLIPHGVNARAPAIAPGLSFSADRDAGLAVVHAQVAAQMGVHR